MDSLHGPGAVCAPLLAPIDHFLEPPGVRPVPRPARRARYPVRRHARYHLVADLQDHSYCAATPGISSITLANRLPARRSLDPQRVGLPGTHFDPRRFGVLLS